MWTAQAGRVERNLQVFIFTSHTLSDPLGARASSPPPPCRAVKASLPAQAPRHQTAPFNRQESVLQK